MRRRGGAAQSISGKPYHSHPNDRQTPHVGPSNGPCFLQLSREIKGADLIRLLLRQIVKMVGKASHYVP